MPERAFDSGYWDHPDIQPLSRDATLLYPYLWTNGQCLASGLYHVTIRTMSFATKIPEDDISAALTELAAAKKIEWYPDDSLVWVKNFVKRQARSPKFLIAAGKALQTISRNGLVDDFVRFNMDTYGIRIPLPDPINSLSYGIGRNAAAAADTAAVSVSKEGGKGGESDPDDKDAEMAVVAELYESHIGMLTMSSRNRLLVIVDEYPRGWFARAVDEACYYNHRNLAYIEKMMARWQVDGLPPTIAEKSKTAGKDDASATGSPRRRYQLAKAPDEGGKA